MCKSNLGCDKRDCGCPTCTNKSVNKKMISIPSASLVPSGYSKKQKSSAPLPSGSGYAKKITNPSFKETKSPKVEVGPIKEDNSGFIIAGVGFVFSLLLAEVKDRRK